MKKDVMEYFKSEYEKASFRVVPGHWPDFKTKDEVSDWLINMEAFIAFTDKTWEDK